MVRSASPSLRPTGRVPPRAPRRALAPIALLALPALALSLAGCEALSNSRLATFGAEYWEAEPSGTIQGTNGAAIGDEIDVEDTLDLDSEKVWIYYAGGTIGPTRLEATWIDLESSGIATAPQSFDYGGVTYDAGDTVQGAIDTSVLQLHTATPAAAWEMVTLGIVAGIDQLVIDSQVGNLTDGTFAQEDYDEWVPVIGLVAGASFPAGGFEVFVDGKISGMYESISFGTFEGDYLSYLVRTGLDIDDGFKIGAGWRVLDADIDDNHDDIDFELDGLTFFAEMNF